MQQYFINTVLNENDKVVLDKEVLYHFKKVLRKTDGYEFRLVDSNSNVFLSELNGDCALIKTNLHENNELDVNITVILSLIKSDKFELTLQKLCELGVKRIIPYNAIRSQVKYTKSSKLDRFKKILQEASEQSHRNIIPEILEPIDLKEIKNYLSDVNLLAYEKQDSSINDIKNGKSYTIIIGPEGGFDENEVKYLQELNFHTISLGNRILRAETAAIYLTSIIVGESQK